MAIKEIPLENICDNPFNPRKNYSNTKVKEMADSLRENGLRQTPEGREIDGMVQLVYGHMRLRGYRYNQKHKAKGSWTTMPVDVKDFSNQEMFDYAWEENVRRTDITSLELARCIGSFSEAYPDVLDEDIAKKHGMTAANVSNMKRVLRLPEKFLNKIDEGKISFTQGRELLTIEGLPDAEALMTSALGSLNTSGNRYYGKPNTVQGLQESIHEVIRSKFKPLDKSNDWRNELLFDVQEAGCLKCENCFVTHPTKSQAAHFCTNGECWDGKNDEQKKKAAAAAMAKMKQEIIQRAATDISQEKSAVSGKRYTLEKRGNTWVAVDIGGTIIAIGTTELHAGVLADESFKPVTPILNPNADNYKLNHTYRIIAKPGIDTHTLEDGHPIIDVIAQDLPAALKAMDLKTNEVETVKVWKSSGKLGTAGGVSAGWSKCTESMERKLPGQVEPADETDRELDSQTDSVMAEAGENEDITAVAIVLCADCLNYDECDRSHFYAGNDGKLHCDMKQTAASVGDELPEEVMEQARTAAGTRAEVLDLNDISTGSEFNRQLKGGYTILKGSYHDILCQVDAPEECAERCVSGFHYAFDSSPRRDSRDDQGNPIVFSVCSNPGCLSRKKGAFTKKRNAEGQARKNAERKAIKDAMEVMYQQPKSLLKLVLYAQIHGSHISNYFHGDGVKTPATWLWDRVSAGTKSIDRSDELLFSKIDSLPIDTINQLVGELAFYYLVDRGDVSRWEIKTGFPLSFFGVKVDDYITKGGKS